VLPNLLLNPKDKSLDPEVRVAKLTIFGAYFISYLCNNTWVK